MARVFLLASASLLLAAPAFGQAVDDGTGTAYIMAQSGELRYKQQNVDDITFKDTTTVNSLVGGYNVHRYFAVEGAYSKTRNLSVEDSIEMNANYWTVRAVGRIPLTEMAPGGSVIAGIAHNRFSSSASAPGLHLADKNSHNSWLIGGQINAQNVQFRLTYEDFRISGADATLWNLGVGYRF